MIQLKLLKHKAKNNNFLRHFPTEEIPQTCTAMSHVSYVTFDGAAIKFDGTCRYVLTAVSNEYRILVQNAQMKPLRRAPMAYTKEVIVEFGSFDNRCR